MIGIEDIEHRLSLTYKFGHSSMPEFALLNTHVINNIFSQGISTGHISNTHYCHREVWTRFGKIELLPCSFLKNDEVILSYSRNIVLNVFYKLGFSNGKNAFYR